MQTLMVLELELPQTFAFSTVQRFLGWPFLHRSQSYPLPLCVSCDLVDALLLHLELHLDLLVTV